MFLQVERRLPPLSPEVKSFTLVAVDVLALPTAAAATPWRDEPAVTALFRDSGVDGTFVLLDEGRGELRGHNQSRAEQRSRPLNGYVFRNCWRLDQHPGACRRGLLIPRTRE